MASTDESSLFFGPAPSFENSQAKPSAVAKLYWKWNSKWALQLTDSEIETLVSECHCDILL